MKRLLVVVMLLLLAPATARVYDANTDPPPGCAEVAGTYALTVHGGRDHVIQPGQVFGFDVRDLQLPACTQVDVTFVNDDDVRHMWMVHDVWPNGTFLLEVDGTGMAEGSFVLPADTETLLVHCGIPTHQQMGMKAQIRVAGGVGDLANVPGLSGIGTAAGDHPGQWYLVGVMGALVALAGLFWWRTRD